MKQQQIDLLNELNRKELLIETNKQELEQATVSFTIIYSFLSVFKFFLTRLK